MPWAHLDIAGTAYDNGKPYAPKGGAGFGVRTLVELARAKRALDANTTERLDDANSRGYAVPFGGSEVAGAGVSCGRVVWRVTSATVVRGARRSAATVPRRRRGIQGEHARLGTATRGSGRVAPTAHQRAAGAPRRAAGDVEPVRYSAVAVGEARLGSQRAVGRAGRRARGSGSRRNRALLGIGSGRLELVAHGPDRRGQRGDAAPALRLAGRGP